MSYCLYHVSTDAKCYVCNEQLGYNYHKCTCCDSSICLECNDVCYDDDDCKVDLILNFHRLKKENNDLKTENDDLKNKLLRCMLAEAMGSSLYDSNVANIILEFIN
jgi:hypothetical protein